MIENLFLREKYLYSEKKIHFIAIYNGVVRFIIKTSS
jgi:hypothetical protein